MRGIGQRQSWTGEESLPRWQTPKGWAGRGQQYEGGRHVLISVLQLPWHSTARVLGRGFTLLELVLSMAVTGILVLTMGSAMMFAARAMPDAKSVVATTMATAEALNQVATDLQYAVSITQRSATMIEFTVADRDGNDIPETIRYAWSGLAGAPLTRQYNGGTADSILTDVRQFSLSYTLTTTSTEIPQANESAETILASYSSTKNLYDYPIMDTERYAEYFFPTLPANTVSWKVTRVIVQAKLDGANDGQAGVQLQLLTLGNQVSGVVLEEKTLLESTLATKYGSQEFAFSAVSGLAPTRGLWIVFKWLANGTACRVQGQSSGVTATNLALAKSIDRGLSWSTLAGQSLLFTVYGTVTTAGTPQIQTTYNLEGIDLKLRASSDAASLVQTGVRVLNRPPVSQ